MKSNEYKETQKFKSLDFFAYSNLQVVGTPLFFQGEGTGVRFLKKRTAEF